MTTKKPIKAEDYGVSESNLDNTETIQNAINAAVEEGRDAVKLPAGTFSIKEDINGFCKTILGQIKK